jgi:hypothetical protein
MASEIAKQEAVIAKQKALDRQGELDLLFAQHLMEMEEASEEEVLLESMLHEEVLEDQEEEEERKTSEKETLGGEGLQVALETGSLSKEESKKRNIRRGGN